MREHGRRLTNSLSEDPTSGAVVLDFEMIRTASISHRLQIESDGVDNPHETTQNQTFSQEVSNPTVMLADVATCTSITVKAIGLERPV